jgi:hypothetical protein
MDRDGMSILYRGSSIDVSYQVSDHLAKQLQKRRIVFFRSANQKQESPVAAMFINGSGRNEQWGPSINASYQVSGHLAEGFRDIFICNSIHS